MNKIEKYLADKYFIYKNQSVFEVSFFDAISISNMLIALIIIFPQSILSMAATFVYFLVFDLTLIKYAKYCYYKHKENTN